MLGSLLNDIDIPHEAVVCHDKMFSIHKQDICAYHDAIIMIMIQACSETIPISKSGCNNGKAVSGWNEYIEGYFRTSLIWHSLGIDNGKLRLGIVAELKCKTRAQYHRVCKMVLRKDAKIRCDKMIEANISNPSGNSLYQHAMHSVIRKLIILKGLPMLRVKVRFLICLQINFKTCITVFLI